MKLEDSHKKQYRFLKFDATTRSALSQKFITALMEGNPGFTDFDGSADREGDLFVRCLEGIAENSQYSVTRETQKRRRERVEAVANALDALIDYIGAVDDAALGYALWNGLNKASENEAIFSNADRSDVQMMEGMPSVLLAYRLQQGREAEALRSFADGVRGSIKTLPPLDKRQHDFIDQLAKFIEDYLARRNIQVTTSDTGLAGSALIATVELAELHAPRAGYRMKMANDSPDSWKNFVLKMIDHHKNDSGTR